MEIYCSSDAVDVAFGAIGSWENSEAQIMAGVANPPLEKKIIAVMMPSFDWGVQRRTPYLRAAVLPSGSSYNVRECVCDAGGLRQILTFIPSGNVGFKYQSILSQHHPDSHFPQLLRDQRSLLCVWENAGCWRYYPPSADVEDFLAAWVLFSCRDPKTAVIEYNSVDLAFQGFSRSEEEAVKHFAEHLT